MGVIVPLSGADSDEQALAVIAAAYPGRKVVGVPGLAITNAVGGQHRRACRCPAARGPPAARTS
ncbi:MAG: agmatine deiminase family protein [Solirubrobacteraceae bacterium]